MEPEPFQPPNACTPGQAPVVAPARRLTYRTPAWISSRNRSHLGRLLRVDARRQPVHAGVGELEGLVERVHRGDRGEGSEQLVVEQPVRGGQAHHRGLNEVATGQGAVGQALAAREHRAVAARLGHRLLVPVHRRLVDDRSR